MHAPWAEPFEQFAALYEQAKVAQPKDPNAMVLATVDANGRPSARVVLLKGFDQQGFVFYTNQRSRKGRELLEQKVAALCIHWPALDRQVRIEGEVSVVSDAEADEYFATRHPLSQLGAWASLQSEPLDERATFERRLDEVRARFAGQPTPRPPHWGGFRLAPDLIELWQAEPNRLHHRRVYTREGDGWASTLLFP